MTYDDDNRIVMTLDAGGTNFVFSAMQGNMELINPITLPSSADNLDACLSTLIEGFSQTEKDLPTKPEAISFAFPGPADYPNGIIGDLTNLPAFRGGIAIGPMLRKKFECPVFINNDGDLFTFGEALAGILPKINQKLIEANSPKRYKNLLGITLGTGFGAGIVRDGQLFLGDNSASAEIWCIRNKIHTNSFAEEGASIRGVQYFFAESAGIPLEQAPTPKELYEIACGRKPGNQEAAVAAFHKMGQVVGDALANAITLIDGLVVIGGGLTGAHEFFLPSIINEMNSHLYTLQGESVPRFDLKAFNLEDNGELRDFIKGQACEINVPHSHDKLIYDPLKRTGVGLSVLGASKAVAIGAYAFALMSLDQDQQK